VIKNRRHGVKNHYKSGRKDTWAGVFWVEARRLLEEA